MTRLRQEASPGAGTFLTTVSGRQVWPSRLDCVSKRSPTFTVSLRCTFQRSWTKEPLTFSLGEYNQGMSEPSESFARVTETR